MPRGLPDRILGQERDVSENCSNLNQVQAWLRITDHYRSINCDKYAILTEDAHNWGNHSIWELSALPCNFLINPVIFSLFRGEKRLLNIKHLLGGNTHGCGGKDPGRGEQSRQDQGRAEAWKRPDRVRRALSTPGVGEPAGHSWEAEGGMGGSLGNSQGAGRESELPGKEWAQRLPLRTNGKIFMYHSCWKKTERKSSSQQDHPRWAATWRERRQRADRPAAGSVTYALLQRQGHTYLGADGALSGDLQNSNVENKKEPTRQAQGLTLVIPAFWEAAAG